MYIPKARIPDLNNVEYISPVSTIKGQNVKGERLLGTILFYHPVKQHILISTI